MNRKYLLRRIAQDCIPTVFSLLMSGLYGVMDGLFVGRAVGDAGLAAINIAWPIAAVITAVGIGIGSGGSVLYSNSNGKGEQERRIGVSSDHHTSVCSSNGITYCAWIYISRYSKCAGSKRGCIPESRRVYSDYYFRRSLSGDGNRIYSNAPESESCVSGDGQHGCRDGSQWGIELSVIICCKNRNPGSGSWDNCCTVCCVGDQFLSYLWQAESTSQGSVAT